VQSQNSTTKLSQKQIAESTMLKLYDVSCKLNEIRSLMHQNKTGSLKKLVCNSLDRSKEVMDTIISETNGG